MSEPKTHYELLGVAPDATPEQLKQRFRELARKHHPDVNPDRPECHELFLKINQAYEVLRDPGRRARYDLDLRDQARREADRRSGAFGSAPYTGRPPTAAGPPRAPGGTPGSTRPRSSPAAERRRVEAERRRQEFQRLIQEARQAYQRGHLREAQELCQTMLAMGRFGPAHELLGDVYARQGRSAEAVDQYTIAAQMIAANGHIMAKLNREAARATSHERTYPDLGWTKTGTPVEPKHLSYQLAVSFFGVAVMLLLMLWPLTDTDPLRWPLVSAWTFSHLARMAISGILAGGILAAAAWIRPIDRELFYPTLGLGRLTFPLGLVLPLLAVVSFPVVLLVYPAIAYRQGVSKSIVTALGATCVLVFGFWLSGSQSLSAEAQLQTILFGGNLVFVTLLCGWFIGDLFRPSWAT